MYVHYAGMNEDMRPKSWYDRTPSIPGVHGLRLEEELDMQRAIVGLLLGFLLLAACSAPAPAQPQTGAGGKPQVTVYRSPT